MDRVTGAPAPAAQRHPDERWRALCPPEFIEQFLRYDHHVVWLEGRPAVLLTYPWHEIDPFPPAHALPLEVSFTFAAGHPPAPPELRAIAQALAWTPLKNLPSAS